MLITGDITDLKEEASTIAEAIVKDVKKDTFFQHPILSKQRANQVFKEQGQQLALPFCGCLQQK